MSEKVICSNIDNCTVGNCVHSVQHIYNDGCRDSQCDHYPNMFVGCFTVPVTKGFDPEEIISKSFNKEN